MKNITNVTNNNGINLTEFKKSELITYSIFHTKNTKAQEEICFIVRREADKVFSYPSEPITDARSPILPTSTPHTFTHTQHQPR